MRNDERQSLARAKRAARVAQRAVDVLGGTAEGYHWLTTPCAALRGKAPSEIRFDGAGARRVAVVLRRRASRLRSVRNAWSDEFGDDATLGAWLWKKNRALGNRRPAMLLDTGLGAAEVLRLLRDRNELRAARMGATEARNRGAIPASKVKRDPTRR